MTSTIRKGVNIEFLENRAEHSDQNLRAVCTDFILSPNPKVQLESNGNCNFYPGDKGKIWETRLRVQNGGKPIYVPVVIFDSDHGKNMIQDRFSWGREARNKFRICTATFLQLFLQKKFQLFQDTFEKIFANPIGNLREHQIVRAGKAMTLKYGIPNLTTQEDIVKRRPSNDERLYQGEIKKPIFWGHEENDIAAEICGASGANLEIWGKSYVENKLQRGLRGKRILLNMAWISIEALIRFLEVVTPHGIEVILVCWEGIFNVYPEDIYLLNGDIIHAGTLINIYPLGKKNLCSKDTFELIEKVFPAEIKPDLCGEAGEMIQDDLDIPTTVYNINEFAKLGIPLGMKPWRTKVWIALRKSPGAAIELQKQTPQIYNQLLGLGILKKNEKTEKPFEKGYSIDVL